MPIEFFLFYSPGFCMRTNEQAAMNILKIKIAIYRNHIDIRLESI